MCSFVCPGEGVRKPITSMPGNFQLSVDELVKARRQLIEIYRGQGRTVEQRQPLLLGELWAFPIMLRLALIENLRRVAARVAIAQPDINPPPPAGDPPGRGRP